MNFESYINQAWTDHATHSQKVADSFSEATALVENGEQLIQLIALFTHVMGEHLGKWAEGQTFLEGLRGHNAFTAGTEVEKALKRSVAVMKLGRNESPNLDEFGRSDQIRVSALASSALSEKNPGRAQELLLKALELARLGLEQKDPANRSLAITGNNLACTLEEKKSRTPAETNLMILAAKTGREYWEVAGGWVEVSRAEYRLGMTYLQAGDPTKALKHAQACLEMCRDNQAGHLDMFFAWEVLARVEKARQNELGFNTALDQVNLHFAKLETKDQTWCESSLKKLIS